METQPRDNSLDYTGDPSAMAGHSSKFQTIKTRGTGFAPEKTADLVAPPRWYVNEQKRLAAEREQLVTENGARKVAKVALKAARKNKATER